MGRAAATRRRCYEPCPRCSSLIVYEEYVPDKVWCGSPHECRKGRWYAPIIQPITRKKQARTRKGGR